MVAQLKSEASDRPALLVVPPAGTIQAFSAAQRSVPEEVLVYALRVAAQGNGVLVVQFLQGGIDQGIHNPRYLVERLTWVRGNFTRRIDENTTLTPAEVATVNELWKFARNAIASGDYDTVVLDDVDLLVRVGAIAPSEIIDALLNRPQQVDVVLSGVDLPEVFLNCADRITQLRR